MKKILPLLLFVCAFAPLHEASAQPRPISRITDVRTVSPADTIQWFAGEAVTYDVLVRNRGAAVTITNAPVWYVVDSRLTNFYVLSTGTVVSATNGQVRFSISSAQSALTSGVYQSFASVPDMVLDRVQIAVMPNANYRGLFVGPVADASFWSRFATNIFAAISNMIPAGGGSGGGYDGDTNAIAILSPLISAETAARIGTGTALSNSVASETAARIAADAALSNSIAGFTGYDGDTNAIAILTPLLSAETSSRVGADSALSNSIAASANSNLVWSTFAKVSAIAGHSAQSPLTNILDTGSFYIRGHQNIGSSENGSNVLIVGGNAGNAGATSGGVILRAGQGNFRGDVVLERNEGGRDVVINGSDGSAAFSINGTPVCSMTATGTTFFNLQTNTTVTINGPRGPIVIGTNTTVFNANGDMTATNCAQALGDVTAGTLAVRSRPTVNGTNVMMTGDVTLPNLAALSNAIPNLAALSNAIPNLAALSNAIPNLSTLSNAIPSLAALSNNLNAASNSLQSQITSILQYGSTNGVNIGTNRLQISFVTNSPILVTIPAGYSNVEFQLWGGAGGSSGAGGNGGGGGHARAVFAIPSAAGQSFDVFVGNGGMTMTGATNTGSAYGGGGIGYSTNTGATAFGGGGGATYVTVHGQTNVLLCAGGGGGAFGSANTGGSGGGVSGGSGNGAGGTQSSGGASGGGSSGAGGWLTGGNGATNAYSSSTIASAGGGSGIYGGGGGGTGNNNTAGGGAGGGDSTYLYLIGTISTERAIGAIPVAQEAAGYISTWGIGGGGSTRGNAGGCLVRF